MTDTIKCADCEYRVPQFVRLVSGAQRSGYRMLSIHRSLHHPEKHYAGGKGRFGVQPSRKDDCCVTCDGRGCNNCEPNGRVFYDGNTGEPRDD